MTKQFLYLTFILFVICVDVSKADSDNSLFSIRLAADETVAKAAPDNFEKLKLHNNTKNEAVWVSKQKALDGSIIADARVVMPDPKPEMTYIEVKSIQKMYPEYTVEMIRAITKRSSNPELVIQFTEDGARKFREFTSTNIGRTIAIVFNNKILLNPLVLEEIKSSQLIYNADSNEEDLNAIAQQLRAITK